MLARRIPRLCTHNRHFSCIAPKASLSCDVGLGSIVTALESCVAPLFPMASGEALLLFSAAGTLFGLARTNSGYPVESAAALDKSGENPEMAVDWS
jgi:hypothetical protein